MDVQAVKQKMCWNCDARVDFGVENCSSCGVYLSTSPLLEQSNDYLPQNHYEPPYRLVSEGEEKIPQSPYQMEEEVVEDEEKKSSFTFAEWKAELTPLVCLLFGSVFSLFGLVLFLFSEGGTFTLQWNGEYWYFYTLLGVPLLYFGWRSLDAISEDSSTPAGEDPSALS